jgi:hypothetical protein
MEVTSLELENQQLQ